MVPGAKLIDIQVKTKYYKNLLINKRATCKTLTRKLKINSLLGLFSCKLLFYRLCTRVLQEAESKNLNYYPF